MIANTAIQNCEHVTTIHQVITTREEEEDVRRRRWRRRRNNDTQQTWSDLFHVVYEK